MSLGWEMGDDRESYTKIRKINIAIKLSKEREIKTSEGKMQTGASVGIKEGFIHLYADSICYGF